MAGNREEFMADGKAGGDGRKKAFDYIEAQQGKEYKNGETGFELYSKMVTVIREECSEDAVKDFQSRFVDMLDQDYLGKKLMGAFSEGVSETLEKKSGDLVERYYPGGKKAFDEMWEEDCQRAMIRFFDALDVAGELDLIETVIGIWVPKMEEEDVQGLLLTFVNGYARAGRSLKRRGLDIDELYQEDLKL